MHCNLSTGFLLCAMEACTLDKKIKLGSLYCERKYLLYLNISNSFRDFLSYFKHLIGYV